MTEENNHYLHKGLLQQNLDEQKILMKKDGFDTVIVVDGMEGGGKSTLAFQIAKYMDETFDLDRVVFTPEEFEKQIDTRKAYEAIVYDEAVGGLSSRSTQSGTNKLLVKKLMECRKKRLVIIIVIPSFFELDRYVAVHRSAALIHVHLKHMVRGKFWYFSRGKKQLLYDVGRKKYYSYAYPKADFPSTFGKHMPIDEDEYIKKNLEAIRTFDQEAGGVLQKKYKKERDALLLIYEQDLKQPRKNLPNLLRKYGVDYQLNTINQVYTQLKRRAKENGLL